MDAETQNRTLPHDAESERAIIASVLVYGADAMDESGGLQDGDFYALECLHAWKAISSLASRHEPTDPVTVGAELASLGLEGRFDPSWQTWAFEAAKSAQVPQMVAHFAGIVRQMAVLRRLIETCVEVSAKAYSRQPADEVLSLAREQISKLEIYGDENEPKRVGEVLPEVLAEIESRQRGEGKAIRSSISTLHRIIVGYKAGQLILWAARPAEGKTAAVLKEGLGAAVDQGIPVLLSSHEMSVQENVERELGMKAKVEVSRIVNGRMEYADWKKLQTAAGEIADVPLYIDDRPLPLAKLCATIRRWYSKEVQAKAKRGPDGKKEEHPVALVVVDYAQLVKVEKSFNAQNREREVACVSRELKLMAKELHIAIILVCQLSRAVESRGGYPQLSDLRESGALEQDADVVIFIHCDSPPEDKQARGKSGPRTLVVAKHRNGKTGLADTNWIAEWMEFVGGELLDYDGPDTRSDWQDRSDDR